MKYVYVLRSEVAGERCYVGVTGDLRERLARHNSGQGGVYTAEFKPWSLLTYVAFSDESLAFDFERYLKSSSGRAFMRKRLR